MGLTGGHDCLLFGPKTLFFSNWKSLELTASNGFFLQISTFCYIDRYIHVCWTYIGHEMNRF